MAGATRCNAGDISLDHGAGCVREQDLDCGRFGRGKSGGIDDATLARYAGSTALMLGAHVGMAGYVSQDDPELTIRTVRLHVGI